MSRVAGINLWLAVAVSLCLAGSAAAQSGTVWAWGDNDDGELGINSTTSSGAPVQVVGTGGSGYLTGVRAVAAGWDFTVVLLSNSTVWTWGDNSNGELGDNEAEVHSKTPIQVLGFGGSGFLTGVVAVAVTGGDHTVALLSNSTVVTWGYNSNGQLGDGTLSLFSAVPVQVVGPSGSGVLAGIVAVSAGYAHSVALRSDGTVWAWGDNGYGELGDNGAEGQSNRPIQVLGLGGSGHLTGVVAVAAGNGFTMALKSDGTVWAWGYNGAGQVGDGTITNRLTPVQVVGPGGAGYLTSIVAVAAGFEPAAAVKSDGTVWCWGWGGEGELGDNGAEQWTSAPVQVLGFGGSGYLTGAVAIAAGWFHMVVLRSDGTVAAWGDNSSGELGDIGHEAQSNLPVRAVSASGSGLLTGIAAVAAGLDFTVALANPLPSMLRVTTATPSDWVYQNTPVSTRDRHYLALTTSVTADTWGNTSYTATVSLSGPGVVRPSLTFVNSSGSGSVTPTTSFAFAAGTAKTFYLVGGRVQGGGIVGSAANLAVTGSCTVTVSVVGNVSGPFQPAPASVTINVSLLGDINDSKQIDGPDLAAGLAILNARLNNFNITTRTDADCDLSGNGAVTAADRVILYKIISGLAVP